MSDPQGAAAAADTAVAAWLAAVPSETMPPAVLERLRLALAAEAEARHGFGGASALAGLFDPKPEAFSAGPDEGWLRPDDVYDADADAPEFWHESRSPE